MAEIGKDINKAKQLLAAGELVAIPTETVYGLAANALNAEAVTKIFQVKNRPVFDPLIVHVASLDQAKTHIRNIPSKAERLANSFWPGPLTLVLEKNDDIPELVTSGLPTAGFRCPDHHLARKLLEVLDFPLAAPSANPFGYISPTTPQHVQDQLGDKISYILDGGPSAIGIESTIIGFDNHGAIVYRTGGLNLEEIEKITGTVRSEINTSSDPKSPGQLVSHYAPGKKLVVGDLEKLIAENASRPTGVLSFRKDYGVPCQFILSPSGDLAEAARNLFSALRKLDASPVEVIVAEFVPDRELGRAINDRLKRASH